MKESEILYEKWPYWICAASNGFEVYRCSSTHSVRVAQIGYKGAVGMEKAKAEIERRRAVELI